MCGVTKLGNIGNERIRGTTKVRESTKKVQERRMRREEHVLRMKEGDGNESTGKNEERKT